MKLTIELTPDQFEAIAAEVARRLQPMTRRPYTIAEASKALGVSWDTVSRRVKAGTIASVPGLGVTRIPVSEIERLTK